MKPYKALARVTNGMKIKKSFFEDFNPINFSLRQNRASREKNQLIPLIQLSMCVLHILQT